MSHKPKPSKLIGQATDISAQDRAGQATSFGKAQGTLDQFEGPVEKSPFYKSLLKTGTESTSNQYQTARSNMRGRAKSAGFGYAQPVAQGADASMDNAEAKSLAEVPDRAMSAAAPLSLQASEQTAGMGKALGTQGADYFKSAVPLEQQYQDQTFQQQQAMWNALAQIPQDLTMLMKPMAAGG